MIIAVAHTKGGVGKSTISWNIATQLNKDHTIELVDLDFQKTLTYINEYRNDPLTISHFEEVKELENYIKQDSDEKISIIDVGGFDSNLNRISIIMADLVITPVSDSGTELLGLIRFNKILDELGKTIGERITVNILLNNINPQKKSLEDLKEFVNGNNNFNLFKTVLRSRADYGKAIDKGQGIIEYKKASKGANEMREFIKELNTIIKDNING